jgi:hypothetical protein
MTPMPDNEWKCTDCGRVVSLPWGSAPGQHYRLGALQNYKNACHGASALTGRQIDRVTHMYSNQGYDESEVWCGERDYYRFEANSAGPPHVLSDASDDIEMVSCRGCLTKLIEIGDEAKEQLGKLK